MADSPRLFDLINSAKALARDYYTLTGRPLGITGEIAEVEAARLLGLELAGVRQAGYDAVRRGPEGTVEHLQIKGRCCPPGTGPGQRVGSIRLEKQWDAVLLVLMDMEFEVREIHEASRGAVTAALARPGSVARNVRGALGVNTFKSIGKQVWGPTKESMPQNRDTGAAGNTIGRTTAPRIATAIGAVMKGTKSNEAIWNGRAVVIKCAGPRTTSVGVIYDMLDTVEAVVAAFQMSDSRFDVLEMSSDNFRTHARKSGTNERVGLVTRRAFETHGTPIQSVVIPEVN
jgi:hypothetical protein